MKTKITIAIILSTQLFGCSAYQAISQPGSVDTSSIGIGTPRQEIISKLGTPKMIDTNQQGQKTDMFEFVSGANQATKARAILYVAADLFTLFASEIITWPLELTVFDAAKCTGLAVYDDKLKIKSWSLSDKNGMTIQGC